MSDVSGRLKNFCWLVYERYVLDYVFIHINKNGGSSIERALGLRPEHLTALEKRERLGAQSWNRKFRFTFVRNPWDKVVSHYEFRVSTNQMEMREHPIEFNEWVRLAYLQHDPRYYEGEKMFMPQIRWITDEHGAVMLDFIGRFERLETDFSTICEKLNRKTSLPHLKKSGRGDYREYYNSDSIEIVRTCFREDIDFFRYSFSGEGG